MRASIDITHTYSLTLSTPYAGVVRALLITTAEEFSEWQHHPH